MAETTSHRRLGVSPRARLLLWAMIVAFCLLAMSALVWLGAGNDEPRHLEAIWISSGLLFAGLTAMAILLAGTPPDAIRLPPRVSVAIILAVAAGARLAMLCAWTPGLSDDIFRYRRDGRVVLAGYEPYRYYPTDAAIRNNPFPYSGYRTLPAVPYDRLDRMSNNAEMPTLYLPVSLWVFAGAAWFDRMFAGGRPARPGGPPPVWGAPGHARLARRLAGDPRLLPYRILHDVADLATAALLLACLSAMGKSPWRACLYAWHPLPLIEIAGNGHLESVGVMLLVAAVLAGLKRRWYLAAALLALTLMTKPWAILAVPVFALWYWRESAAGSAPGLKRSDAAWPSRGEKARAILGMAAVYLLVVLACMAPFYRGWRALAHTMGVYARNWNFNGFFFDLLRDYVYRGNTWALRRPLNIMAVALFVGLLACMWRYRWSAGRALGFVLLGYLLFCPQVYPWYVLWPLALVPLAFNAGTWALSLSVLWSYAVLAAFRVTGRWHVPTRVLMIEYLPVIALTIWQLAIDMRSARDPSGKAAGVSGSVAAPAAIADEMSTLVPAAPGSA